jgi:hypothetical protein
MLCTSTDCMSGNGYETWFSNVDFETDGEPSSLSWNLPIYFANMGFNSSSASI